jgi:hypothetical protein
VANPGSQVRAEETAICSFISQPTHCRQSQVDGRGSVLSLLPAGNSLPRSQNPPVLNNLGFNSPSWHQPKNRAGRGLRGESASWNSIPFGWPQRWFCDCVVTGAGRKGAHLRALQTMAVSDVGVCVGTSRMADNTDASCVVLKPPAKMISVRVMSSCVRCAFCVWSHQKCESREGSMEVLRHAENVLNDLRDLVGHRGICAKHE